jgi:hypothetical protein|nr:MAG TPA: hypothetical protein [Caudoviricetes sp.]
MFDTDNDYTIDPEEMVDSDFMSDADLCAMHIDVVIDEKSQLDEFKFDDWVDIYSTLKDMRIIALDKNPDFTLAYENKLKKFYVDTCGCETESGESFSSQLASFGVGKYAMEEDWQAWKKATQELELDKYVPGSASSDFRSSFLDFSKMSQDVKDFDKKWSTEDNAVYNILIQCEYSSGVGEIEYDINAGAYVPFTMEELEAARADFVSQFSERVHNSLDGSDVRVVKGDVTDSVLGGKPALNEKTYAMISKDYIAWLKEYQAEKSASQSLGFGVDYSRQNVDEGLDAFDALVKATSHDKSVVAEASDEKKVLEIDTIAEDEQDIIEY